MHPLDQSNSYNLLTLVSLGRKTMRPYKFADGLIVPKGVDIAAPPLEIHMDEKIYENPLDFDGFRFSRMGEQDTLESAKYFASNTAPEYLHFGHGQHAWYVLLAFIK
jgi:ent-kaurene oxidase